MPTYRGVNKGLHVLLSNSQAWPGSTVKQEQEEISRNHVHTFSGCSVVGRFANFLNCLVAISQGDIDCARLRAEG